MAVSIKHQYACQFLCGVILWLCLVMQAGQVFARDDVAGQIPDVSIMSFPADEKKQADLVRSTTSTTAIMQKLLAWIENNTPQAAAGAKPPPVIFVSSIALQEIAFKNHDRSSINMKARNILGLYNFREEVIYLSDDIDLRTAQGKGVLLHELVHFLQYRHGYEQSIACMNELEPLAYSLEIRYLLESSHADSSQIQQRIQRNACSS